MILKNVLTKTMIKNQMTKVHNKYNKTQNILTEDEIYTALVTHYADRILLYDNYNNFTQTFNLTFGDVYSKYIHHWYNIENELISADAKERTSTNNIGNNSTNNSSSYTDLPSHTTVGVSLEETNKSESNIDSNYNNNITSEREVLEKYKDKVKQYEHFKLNLIEFVEEFNFMFSFLL